MSEPINPFEPTQSVYEWATFDEYMILDGGLDSRACVDECPKCAALVLHSNREKHEGVCWHG